jgi:hypothetical protein
MRMLPHVLLPLLIASTAVLGPLAPGTPLPPVSGERLDGRPAGLPAAARGRVTLVAFGFTRGSSKAVQAWGEHFKGVFAADSAYDWLEVPVLGGAARLARGWITGAMRGGTPVPDRPHVLVVWTDARDWKRRLEYRERDAAYLVLLDRDGRVRWRGHGGFDEERWRELEAAAKSAR